MLLLWMPITGWQREMRCLEKETERGWHRGHRDGRGDPSRGETNKFTLRSWGMIKTMKHKGGLKSCTSSHR